MKKRNVAEMVGVAEQQLVEHKEWLRRAVERAFGGADSTRRRLMILLIDDIEVATVVQEEALKDVSGQPTVSVTYSYPDALYDYLKTAPEELRLALAGGTEMPQ